MKQANVENIISYLNGGRRLDGRMDVLRNFILGRAEMYRRSPGEGERIAYELTALLSTRTCRALPGEHQYIKVLDLAGELELPAERRPAGVTWTRFLKLVDKI
ncbi:hypothetical protein [Parafrankia sp. BMG5.11]|uniref:hypothetical protein n=1 Tax=Parafrankia sp. BMG5.11 TaxID=222540 RepID=UPI00140524F3|nr:hypothetical protein [Parafrankia sp. BMG5.11]